MCPTASFHVGRDILKHPQRCFAVDHALAVSTTVAQWKLMLAPLTVWLRSSAGGGFAGGFCVGKVFECGEPGEFRSSIAAHCLLISVRYRKLSIE